MDEIKWTFQSIEDIDNIAEYIAKDSMKYAMIQVEDFFESVPILQENPKAGRIVGELGDKNVRELIVGLYRVIYHIKSQSQIDILTVYHSSRLLKRKTLKKMI